MGGVNSVKLISGSLSHENTGNQFGHASVVFTFILMGVTAVFQIICLNRGLKVYDSTLVVPVFYGVYTGTGFLNSLIFNDEVDAYHAWTLFFIFCSMIILIAGVVLLTFKKPDPTGTGRTAGLGAIALDSAGNMSGGASRRGKKGMALNGDEEEGDGTGDTESEVMWQLGEASDDEGEPQRARSRSRSPRPGSRLEGLGKGVGGVKDGEGERRRMLDDEDEGDEHNRGSTSSDRTQTQSHMRGYTDADGEDLLNER